MPSLSYAEQRTFSLDNESMLALENIVFEVKKRKFFAVNPSSVLRAVLKTQKIKVDDELIHAIEKDLKERKVKRYAKRKIQQVREDTED